MIYLFAIVESWSKRMKYLPLIVTALIGGVFGWFVNDLANPPATQIPAQSATEISTPDQAGTNPAYMIVLGTVHDRDAFMRGYAAKLAPLYDKYGGHYISIGGSHEILEGQTSFESHVISQWTSSDAARAFWNSPEYAELKRARIENKWGDFDVFLVEGPPLPEKASDLPQKRQMK
jgi:uncharacterized protein (DUF1330 family)